MWLEMSFCSLENCVSASRVLCLRSSCWTHTSTTLLITRPHLHSYLLWYVFYNLIMWLDDNPVTNTKTSPISSLKLVKKTQNLAIHPHFLFPFAVLLTCHLMLYFQKGTYSAEEKMIHLQSEIVGNASKVIILCLPKCNITTISCL